MEVLRGSFRRFYVRLVGVGMYVGIEPSNVWLGVDPPPLGFALHHPTPFKCAVKLHERD